MPQLKETSKIRKLVINPISDGMVPLRAALDRINFCKFSIMPISVGKYPINCRFLERSSICNDFMRPTCDGRKPVKKLVDISKVRNVESKPISEGIKPLRRQFDRESDRKLDMRPTSVGIVADENLLDERSRVSKLDNPANSIGNEPFRALFDRSRNIKSCNREISDGTVLVS